MATPDGPAAGDRVGGRRLATIYRVGEFELRADERRLLRQGQAVALGARAFDLLLCLVEHRDRLMGKDEILAQVWPGVVVEENNLTVQVSALRKLLGADAIATVAGRGYRFTMAVLAPAAAVLSGEAPELDLSLPDKPSIAVLPFINLSGDPEQEYFTDGITEDILTELSRFQTLFVIARNSSFSYKSQAIDIKQIGRELGVRYVVQGSIRKAGQRIRVTAQLVETLTGSHLWAEKYDRVLEDIFAVQEEVTECIVGAVAPHVDAAELLKARRRPGSLSAYELALRARALLLDSAMKTDPARRDEGLRLARQALALDPDSVIALTFIAFGQWQNLAARTAVDRGAAWREGMQACMHGIAIADSNVFHANKAFLNLYDPAGSRWDDVRIEAHLAWQSNPQDASTLTGCGYLLALCGEPEEAIRLLERALRISPRDPIAFNSYANLANAHLAARQYAQGLAWARRATSAAPDFVLGFAVTAALQVALGDIDAARDALARARQLAPQALVTIERSDPSREPTPGSEARRRYRGFLRIAAGLDDPGSAEALR